MGVLPRVEDRPAREAGRELPRQHRVPRRDYVCERYSGMRRARRVQERERRRGGRRGSSIGRW